MTTINVERAVNRHRDMALEALDALAADLGDPDAVARRATRTAAEAELARIAAMTPAEVLGYNIGIIHRALTDLAEGMARGLNAARSERP